MEAREAGEGGRCGEGEGRENGGRPGEDSARNSWCGGGLKISEASESFFSFPSVEQHHHPKISQNLKEKSTARTNFPVPCPPIL